VKETKGKAKAVKQPPPKPKTRKNTQTKATIRRDKIAAAVIAGKTEKQIAAELGMTRDGVCEAKRHPDFQARIAARCEDAAFLTADEVIGTLANQMRSDVTDMFTDDGTFDLQALRENRLGHLIKKIKVRREFAGKGEEKEPVDVIEIEVHSSQAAAIQLAKIMGLETLPKSNPFDDQAKANAFIAAYMSQTGHSEEKAKEQWAAVAPLMSKLIM
jgi:predicted transcriptional regulator